MDQKVRLIECPRDAMQGWQNFISTDKKIRYVNSLLKIGFNTIDVGSFVSAKAIPQMADTKEVIRGLELVDNETKLLVIIANERGAQEAIEFDEISYLGFPFSISPTYQLRNANSTMEESVSRVEKIWELCIKRKKELVLYLSMAFGNPYQDPYNEEVLLYWADNMVKRNIRIISLADTVGLASPQQISFACNGLIPKYPQVEFGVHLHSSFQNRREKLEAAVRGGCVRFDGALNGIGGCPMAQDELVGNMSTEIMISYFEQKGISTDLNKTALAESLLMAGQIFQ